MPDACQERCLLPTISASPCQAGNAAEPRAANERGRLKHAREMFWHYWLPLLVMLTLIKLESTDAMSGEHTILLLARLTLWIGVPLKGASLGLLNMAVRKSGHMLGYGLLCFSWLLLLRGSYWLRHEYQLCLTGSIQVRRLWWRLEWGALAVLCTFVVAAADEFHQMSIPSRGGDWSDVALDTGAALVAAALIWAKARWRCRQTPAIEPGR
jgi:VanZ like family